MESVKLYIELMDKFALGEINAGEFEKEYLQLFKNDDTIKPEKIFVILDKIFSDVDAFCEDTTLCTSEDMDEQQLREQVVKALYQLKELSEIMPI